jgi:hypothetical protein
MADQIKSNKPPPPEQDQPPETHEQTQPVEKVISPQHNTTEPYGRSSEHAKRQTEK